MFPIYVCLNRQAIGILRFDVAYIARQCEKTKRSLFYYNIIILLYINVFGL